MNKAALVVEIRLVRICKFNNSNNNYQINNNKIKNINKINNSNLRIIMVFKKTKRRKIINQREKIAKIIIIVVV